MDESLDAPARSTRPVDGSGTPKLTITRRNLLLLTSAAAPDSRSRGSSTFARCEPQPTT